MNRADLITLVIRLRALPTEIEWVEFERDPLAHEVCSDLERDPRRVAVRYDLPCRGRRWRAVPGPPGLEVAFLDRLAPLLGTLENAPVSKGPSKARCPVLM